MANVSSRIKQSRVLKGAVLAILVSGPIGGGIWAFQNFARKPDVASVLETGARGGSSVYSIELDSRIKTKAGADLGSMVLRGRWQLTSTRQAGRGLAVARFVDLDMTNAGPDGRAQSLVEATARHLKSPLAFELDERGAIQKVHEPINLPSDVASVARAVPSFVQFVRGAGKNRDKWQTEEQDASGTYTAEYRRLSEHKYEKQKLGYTRISGSTSAALDASTKLVVESSRVTYEFDDAGVLMALDLKEELVAAGQFVEGLKTSTTLKLRRVSFDPKAIPEPMPKDLVASGLQFSKKPGTPSLQADVSRTAGIELAAALDRFDELPGITEERSEDQKKEARGLFRSVMARIRLDDAAVGRVVERITEGSTNARSLWAALGAAGTPAAQAALRALIKTTSYSMEDRRSQMVSLSMVERPTAETVDFLHEMFEHPEEGKQARLGLGTAAHNLKELHPEQAARAFAILENELASEPLAMKKAALLEGIGNTGMPRAVAVASPYLASSSEQLRSSAVQGVRLVDGNEADEILARALESDSADTVRMSAVNAIGDRPASQEGLTALARAVESDPSNQVRELAKGTLEKFATGSTQVAEALGKYWNHSK